MSALDNIEWTSDLVRLVSCLVGLGFLPPMMVEGCGKSAIISVFFPCYMMPKFGCW